MTRFGVKRRQSQALRHPAQNRNLLPSVETELNLLEKAVELGAVDGFTGKRAPMVDGFSSEENSEAIELLHGLLSTNGL